MEDVHLLDACTDRVRSSCALKRTGSDESFRCKLLWAVNSPSGDPLTGDVMIATVAIFIHVVLYERFSLLVAEDAVDTAVGLYILPSLTKLTRVS